MQEKSQNQQTDRNSFMLTEISFYYFHNIFQISPF